MVISSGKTGDTTAPPIVSSFHANRSHVPLMRRSALLSRASEACSTARDGASPASGGLVPSWENSFGHAENLSRADDWLSLAHA